MVKIAKKESLKSCFTLNGKQDYKWVCILPLLWWYDDEMVWKVCQQEELSVYIHGEQSKVFVDFLADFVKIIIAQNQDIKRLKNKLSCCT